MWRKKATEITKADIIGSFGWGKTIVDNIIFNVDKNMFTNSMYDQPSVTITLVNKNEKLIVFDSVWLHKGSWCKKIEDIIEKRRQEAVEIRQMEEKQRQDMIDRFDKLFSGE
jgi:hypothetical protein